MNNYTPMMRQYLSIKEKYPDTLILFRLGDFYELFFEDAKIASKELQLVLTGRHAGVKERVPMCGVPHHAIKNYAQRLINRGYKVGIVEQLEDPSLAKGLVDRDVIQIMTPGAFIDFTTENNNYLTSLIDNGFNYSLAYADITTGELFTLNLEKDFATLLSYLDSLETKELVLDFASTEELRQKLRLHRHLLLSHENQDDVLLEFEPLLSDITDMFQMKAVSLLLNYLLKTQKRNLNYLQKVKVERPLLALNIDYYSRKNLELITSLRKDEKYGTLFWLLDETKTSMGKRMLKHYIERPSRDLKIIQQRLDMIETLLERFLAKDRINKFLNDIYDLERLIARISYGNANGRDLLQLKASLLIVPLIKTVLTDFTDTHFLELNQKLNPLTDLAALLEKAIDEDAPITIKEGHIFKKGYHAELDKLISLTEGGNNWIIDFEKNERERTGIKNLKVGYNKVFGYYIEISTGNIPLVKDEFGYIRKQTLTNGERYINDTLKNQETLILNAVDKRKNLEYELFLALRRELEIYITPIQTLATNIAFLDVINSLATVSSKNNYVRPKFNEERAISLKASRHPVLEKVLKTHQFVENDLEVASNTDILLITGPNMGGKSTFMRQIALITIMAQIGCFVPAREANLMLFDQIFTRIGSSDDIISGQSTFMVEMSEINTALKYATENSLLIFDEIGRGTATYDGMALAQAIIEHLASKVHAKTLFSTHYHELTFLEDHLPPLQNMQTLIQEEKDQVNFLYKIAQGAMNKSYGINVARLAGLPSPLLNRATKILKELEQGQFKKAGITVENNIFQVPEKNQLSEIIKKINPLETTPLEALKLLYELKKVEEES